MAYKRYIILLLIAALLIAFSGCVTDNSKAVALAKLKASAALTQDQALKCLDLLNRSVSFDDPAAYFQWMIALRVEIDKSLELSNQTFTDGQACLRLLDKGSPDYGNMVASMDQVWSGREKMLSGFNEMVDVFCSRYGSAYGTIEKF
jgi:hypothetical protein